MTALHNIAEHFGGIRELFEGLTKERDETREELKALREAWDASTQTPDPKCIGTKWRQVLDRLSRIEHLYNTLDNPPATP